MYIFIYLYKDTIHYYNILFFHVVKLKNDGYLINKTNAIFTNFRNTSITSNNLTTLYTTV